MNPLIQILNHIVQLKLIQSYMSINSIFLKDWKKKERILIACLSTILSQAFVYLVIFVCCAINVRTKGTIEIIFKR